MKYLPCLCCINQSCEQQKCTNRNFVHSNVHGEQLRNEQVNQIGFFKYFFEASFFCAPLLLSEFTVFVIKALMHSIYVGVV